MSPREIFTLRDYLGPELKGRTISDGRRVVSLTDILEQTCLVGRFGELSGRSVLLAVSDQLISALAMTELDGVARRMLLCPPDLRADHVQTLIDEAEIDAIVTDQPSRWADVGVYLVMAARAPERRGTKAKTERATEWLMLTSGTSGVPKIVGHTLEALTGAIVADGPARGTPPVWATFYDIRRYGGLQIFLRAILSGGSMVLTEPGEALADHVARLNAMGVTHISGTPSHWRKLLMSGAASGFSPRYVRLSGEIADQAVLDGLRKAFPDASIGHAYASTEAGVGFAVNDGLEGFPASMIGINRDGVEMRVVDGALRIRSTRTAHAYVGRDAAALTDGDGFVDTGDMVELRGDRYHFAGRRGGIINIGGLKVHPEEIEAVINRHDEVRMSRARSRKSPITGSIVVVDVILADGCDASRGDEIRKKILADCRAQLPSHKVPAMIKFVDALDITAAGKLARTDA
ncbi:class I adenylate-forming enzyme family protein [Bradyrhizobium erythrophlei]|jgi:acyl-coenzyme A synthetase/AMP-(fatty) acid ligase|uniref:Long-chain-fatty-acid--CoA ligase n=1 Tax=Bradyrhizobium erythrophlei TaxID=1437360 RepID=A0A1M5LCD0_9BRAD|nr:fatty acid--CoA ligase family protein [Bradyrhizobium erythrophlei]SHG62667.1 Acyl-CoA synthetase (AMP-forming)/AMP-acid ligase II [Bradyrhizobium erythrophlei]